jgi:two-component system, chemotaxis family, sensor kinase CheA
MSAAGDAVEPDLLTLFAGEARGHLARMDCALAALAQGAAPRAALLGELADTVHTLKGAARSVALGDLEYLCHALDGVFAAALRNDAGLRPGQLAPLRAAVELAGQLLDQPAGRVRNQALALIGQLDELARALAAPGGAGISPEPGA